MPASALLTPAAKAARPRPAGDLVLPPVPLSHAQLLIQILEARGISAEQLLQAAGVEPSALQRPDGKLYATEQAALIYQALLLSQDPCLGCELGLAMPTTMLGFLGYALLSASTLGEALELGVKYSKLGSRFVDVQVQKVDGGVKLTMEEVFPLGPAYQLAIESTMIAWLNTAQHLVGTDSPSVNAALHFSWPCPDAYARYRARLPRASFGAAANQIFVPTLDLNRRLALAHPLASRQARALCDSELAELLSSDESFAAQVAESLTLSAAGYPSMAEVASRLRISPRTLMRRLEKLGLSYRRVVEERRRLEAEAQLATPGISIESIATRLGYENPANFTRAFRRWTGESPSQYRGRVLAGSQSLAHTA